MLSQEINSRVTIHCTFCISTLIFVHHSWKATLSLLSSFPKSFVLHLQCLLNSITRAICLKDKSHHIHPTSPIIFSSHFIQNKNHSLWNCLCFQDVASFSYNASKAYFVPPALVFMLLCTYIKHTFNLPDKNLQSSLGQVGEGNGNTLQYCCLENSMDRGVGQAAVRGIAESDTTVWLTFSFTLSPS